MIAALLLRMGLSQRVSGVLAWVLPIALFIVVCLSMLVLINRDANKRVDAAVKADQDASHWKPNGSTETARKRLMQTWRLKLRRINGTGMRYVMRYGIVVARLLAPVCAMSLASCGDSSRPVSVSAIAPPGDKLVCKAEPRAPDTATDATVSKFIADTLDAGADCRAKVRWLHDYFGSASVKAGK